MIKVTIKRMDVFIPMGFFNQYRHLPDPGGVRLDPDDGQAGCTNEDVHSGSLQHVFCWTYWALQGSCRCAARTVTKAGLRAKFVMAARSALSMQMRSLASILLAAGQEFPISPNTLPSFIPVRCIWAWYVVSKSLILMHRDRRQFVVICKLYYRAIWFFLLAKKLSGMNPK